MTYSKIKILITIVTILIVAGCSSKRYDASIHKPKVRFKPSLRALDRLKYETMGSPYVWGAENDGCYDCSGLTYYTLGSMGIEIPRVAKDQFRSGVPVSRENLQKGDLVFFATSRSRPGVATHVGIYLGNGKFQHASSAKRKVVISSLDNPYYARHYLGARRYYNFNRFKPRYQEYKIASYNKPKIKRENKIIHQQFNIQNNQKTQNIFAQTQTNPQNYYLLINTSTNRANEIVTKLELSGLSSKVANGGGTILVGPFSSKVEAQKIKSYNIELLANAQIRSL